MWFKAKKKLCSSKPQGSLETVYLAPAPPGIFLPPFSQNQFSKDISFISPSCRGNRSIPVCSQGGNRHYVGLESVSSAVPNHTRLEYLREKHICWYLVQLRLLVSSCIPQNNVGILAIELFFNIFCPCPSGNTTIERLKHHYTSVMFSSLISVSPGHFIPSKRYASACSVSCEDICQ